jgi:hypothetical protein
MFRKPSLIVGAVILIAGLAFHLQVCKAEDEVKSAPPKKADKNELDKVEKMDIGEIEKTPPAVLDVDPKLEKPLGGKPAAGPVGGTKHTERAVPAALLWLAHHQAADGSWSMHDYTKQCKDKTCTGQSDISSDAGATALGLLPFLAAGQTHKAKGPYQQVVLRGLEWLMQHQQQDGNLGKGSSQMMYGHGLATIALSEDYGMTGDLDARAAAQAAVDFILKSQNPKDGGWRYNPRDPGDTCVLGWQLTALKSAHLAGLDVGGDVFAKASKFLDSVSIRNGAEYGYQPGMVSSPTMTAVGLLGRQYLGAKHDNPMLTGGAAYLMKRLPNAEQPNIYYWYYGTQVMHNMGGNEWDTWWRKIRDNLVRTHVRDVTSCAYGSWDPAKDAWGKRGGRLMETSLSTLTLEVYYRYLPLFKPEASVKGDAGK